MDLIIQAQRKGKISEENFQHVNAFVKYYPNIYNQIIDKIHAISHGIIYTPTGKERKIVHILGVAFGFHTRRYPTKSQTKYRCGRCSEIKTLSAKAVIESGVADTCTCHACRDWLINHYPITEFKHVEFDWTNPLPRTRHNKRQYKAKDGRKIKIHKSSAYVNEEHLVFKTHRYPHVNHSERGRFKKLHNGMPYQDIDLLTQ